MSRYAKILRYDIANGLGWGISIWFTGCSIRCKGCFNSSIWSPAVGKPFTEETIEKILNASRGPCINHLAVLGGEPCDYALNDVKHLVEVYKQEFPFNVVYLWTGYSIDEAFKRLGAAARFIDYIISEPFIEEQKGEYALRRLEESNCVASILLRLLGRLH